MQGSGTIEDGHDSGSGSGPGGDRGGIVHMAARDIFSLIEKDPHRIFRIRVSFVEIYNEEVRDLLVSGKNVQNVLPIRHDPRRGAFVNATENFVTDFESLLCSLFAGEKNRSFASTAMNERSSRSHTIFRITVESQAKPEISDDDDDDDEDDDESEAEEKSINSRDCDDEAVRISTLNLVDLAGTESVRHTGATGERQKEGGKINQR